MSERDIIDDIDALVDAQLEQEASGYDHNINQARCPHCGDDWHGLKITKRMQSMRSARAYVCGCGSADCFDANRLAELEEELSSYRYAEDDSDVICPGSEFIGPWATKWQIANMRNRKAASGYAAAEPTFGPGTFSEHLNALQAQVAETLRTYAIPQRVVFGAGGHVNHVHTAGPQPIWWEVDNPADLEVELVNSGITQTSDSLSRVMCRATRIIVDDETIELLPDDEGNSARYSIEDDRPTTLAIHAVRPPIAGTWRAVRPIESEPDAEQPYDNGGIIPEGRPMAVIRDFVMGGRIRPDGSEARVRIWDGGWNLLWDSETDERPIAEVLHGRRSEERTNYTRDAGGTRESGRVEFSPEGWSYRSDWEYLRYIEGYANPFLPPTSTDVLEEAAERYREACARIADDLAPAWERMIRRLSEMAESVGIEARRWLPDDPEPDNRTPQQRALDRRRPSHTPPAWANDPARTRRANTRRRHR